MTSSLKKTAGKKAADTHTADDLRTILALHAIAVNEMAQGLCVLDADHRIVLFNRRFIEITGIESTQVRLGVQMRDLFEQSGKEQNFSSAATTGMWSEIKSAFRRGGPFRLRRRFRDSGTVDFNFRPTPGNGWVLTCEKPPEKTSLDVPDDAKLLNHVVEHVSHGLCVFDADRRLILCNEQYLQIYGCDRTFIKSGVSLRDILKHATSFEAGAGTAPGKLEDELFSLFRQEEATQRLSLSGGRIIEMRVLPIATGGWLTEHEDVTRKVLHEQTLHDRNQLLDAALDHMAHGLCAFDDQLNLIVVNKRYLEIYGLTFEDARPGTPLIELMRGSISRGIHDASMDAEQMFADFKMRLIENKEPELHRHLANGRVIAVRHRPMVGGGWVGTYEDITERYRSEERIARIARRDALTELPNRLLFGEKMVEGLARVAEKGESMAVMCFDLDNFKAVNDSLGHPIGDKLLQELAKRLCVTVGAQDTVARLGGDEFAIIHPAVSGRDAENLARRLIRATSTPFVIEGHEIHSSICVGIAIAPEHGITADQLMKCADLALYRAKAQGRNSWRLFDAEMDVQIQARRALEIDLRRAFTAGEFHMHYQPLIKLATNEIVGMEALVRWTHPERGAISPGEFIPIAEETGLIVALGEWVLRQACAEAVKWPASIRLSVNLSPLQFRSRTLVSVVINALAATRLSASRLELEITEAAMMQNDDSVVSMLHQLREFGVRIAMDDFGTGYSSLSYLRRFPFDRIKIDQSFIADSDSNADSAIIVRTIAALGDALGIETTAEGIETVEQLELVQRAGCTEGQGYLIGRPRPASDIPDVIGKFQRLVSAA
jgi:diguanylate cyclase (GGDEF)-like protein